MTHSSAMYDPIASASFVTIARSHSCATSISSFSALALMIPSLTGRVRPITES
jgi:hypothetical protein